MTITAASIMTPPEVARLLRVTPEKIIALIRRGEIQAFNVSLSLRRPRWRITPEALATFQASRSNCTPAPAPEVKPARRRKFNGPVKKFF